MAKIIIEERMTLFLQLFHTGHGDEPYPIVSPKLSDDGTMYGAPGAWVPLTQIAQVELTPWPTELVVEGRLKQLSEKERQVTEEYNQSLFHIATQRNQLLQLPAPKNPNGIFDPEEVIGGESQPVSESPNFDDDTPF